MTLSIEVRDLRLRYGDTTALDDLSLTLPGGRIYGLLGRNGSGKTSLLSVLAAYRRASAGTVLVDGQPVFENPRVTRRVCLIRETGDAPESGDSVRDTLAIAARLRSTWDHDYADKLVERFALPPGKKVNALSRGQRSALGCLMGLAARAPLTMFDESHLGMDAATRQAFQEELLADFMATPRTVIVSTHLIEEFGPLFEQVLIIDRGRLVLHDETDALRSRGASFTGPAATVADLTAGLTVLGTRELGPTASVMVYGTLDGSLVRRAREAGVEIGPVALQDLVTHLTQPSGEPS